MKSSETACNRCRPHLGTFVTVSVQGSTNRRAQAAVERAFAAIRRVEESMSFHEPTSELSRLNRTPVGRWMRISPALAEVLELAIRLQHETRGRFNVAIGDALVAWEILPGRKARTAWDNLARPGFELSRDRGGHRARRILSVLIDLGGIAKGFAVDLAAEAALRADPKCSGFVNAGGEIRAFGKRDHPVLVRSGSDSAPVMTPVTLREESIATSSIRVGRGKSAYVDIPRRRPRVARKTAVVVARRCVVADALTKVALLLPPAEAGRVASRHGAVLKVLA